MIDIFGYSGNTTQGYIEVRDYITYGDGINELGAILGNYNLNFSHEEELQEFVKNVDFSMRHGLD